MDAVIAYVDGMEPNWRLQYNKHIGGFGLIENRFIDRGTLKYVLRGISKHMTFIDKVFLLVSSLEQVPDYINDKVIIITHNMFIPNEYLPTFNANTIEAFLWNIPDLSEEFIYFNDDMIPVNHMTEEDFFREHNPCLNFRIEKTNSSEFNSFLFTDNLFASMTGNVHKQEDYLWTHHIMTPYLKSKYFESFYANKDAILHSINPIRCHRQFSQHYFSNCLYYQGKYIDYKLEYLYLNTRMPSKEFIKKMENINNIKALCINDYGDFTDKTTLESENILIQELNKILPNKSFYEK